MGTGWPSHDRPDDVIEDAGILIRHKPFLCLMGFLNVGNASSVCHSLCFPLSMACYQMLQNLSTDRSASVTGIDRLKFCFLQASIALLQ